MAKRSQKGVTLLELTVAMALMGVVGLSFAYLYVNANRYLAQSVISSASQSEASFAMEHIKRRLLHAIQVTGPAVGGLPQSQLDFRVRRDMADPVAGVPAVYRVTSGVLEYSENGGPFIPVARNIIGITFTRTTGVQLGVSITAATRMGGDVHQTTLNAAIGLRGMFQGAGL